MFEGGPVGPPGKPHPTRQTVTHSISHRSRSEVLGKLSYRAAATGALVALLSPAVSAYRVRKGKTGATSNGRSPEVSSGREGGILSNSALSLQGSSSTRLPWGKTPVLSS